MEKVNSYTQKVETSTKGIFKMERHMEKEHTSLKMEINMKVNSIMINLKETVSIIGLKEISLKDNTKMIKSMVKGFISIKMSGVLFSETIFRNQNPGFR